MIFNFNDILNEVVIIDKENFFKDNLIGNLLFIIYDLGVVSKIILFHFNYYVNRDYNTDNKGYNKEHNFYSCIIKRIF